MDRYAINFLRLTTWLLPTFLRRRITISWLHAALKHVRDLHDQFIVFGREKKDEVKWNGQTIILENLLIQRFGAGIYITNQKLDTNGAYVGVDGDETFYIGVDLETSHYIGVEYSLNNVSFLVYVPSSIPFDQDVMIALINKYKLYNTNFEIIIY